MVLFGAGEAATRALSLLFALAAVPVSFWAGSALFDRRAGALAAAGAAGAPFLTYYAQETRMYSLVVLLSVLASASFALAFVRGRRAHVVWLGVWLALLLYTHTWGLFLTAAMAVAWIVLWRRGVVTPPDGVRLAIVLAALYAPWLPSVLFQAAQHGGAVGGATVAGVAAGRARLAVRLDRAAAAGDRGVLRAPAPPAGRPGGARAGGDRRADASMAWLVSQLEPAWASRYLAVVMGPLLLALAAVVSRSARWGILALVGVAVVWLVSGPPAVKSNVRTVSTGIAPSIRPGDLVVSTQPEQVPALFRYLPAGVVYRTPMGPVQDPRQTDWRDGLERLRAGTATRELLPAIARLARGRRVLIVTPLEPARGPRRRRGAAPCGSRTREWRGGAGRLLVAAARRRRLDDPAAQEHR